MRSRVLLSISLALAVGLGFTAGYVVHRGGHPQNQSPYRPAAAAIVTVPALRGMTQSDAKASLAAAGLAVQVVQVPSATIPKGGIVAVAPAPGSRVRAGTVIDLSVSSGPTG
jgi:hypothetical protein